MKILISYLNVHFHFSSRLTECFIPWTELLRRLLLKIYCGKKIDEIDLHFFLNTTPQRIGGGDFYYSNSIFDFKKFYFISSNSQLRFLWDKVCKELELTAEEASNQVLADACRMAHARGLELNLNPDYYSLSIPVKLYGKSLCASIGVYYDDFSNIYHSFINLFSYCKHFLFSKNHPFMHIFLVLRDENHILKKQKICSIEFKYRHYPDWFIEIEVEDENVLLIKGCSEIKRGHYIFVKGENELNCLPLKIPVSKEVVWGNE